MREEKRGNDVPVFHQNLTTLQHKIVFTLDFIMASLARNHFSPPPHCCSVHPWKMESTLILSVFFHFGNNNHRASFLLPCTSVCFRLSMRVEHYKQQPISLFRHSPCMPGHGCFHTSRGLRPDTHELCPRSPFQVEPKHRVTVFTQIKLTRRNSVKRLV